MPSLAVLFMDINAFEWWAMENAQTYCLDAPDVLPSGSTYRRRCDYVWSRLTTEVWYQVTVSVHRRDQ